MADDFDRDNRWLGIQNLPNQVPGRTLRAYNDFADEMGQGVSKFGDQASLPTRVGSPFTMPTLWGPGWLRLMRELVRGSARDAMGKGGPYDEADNVQFTTRPQRAGGGDVDAAKAMLEHYYGGKTLGPDNDWAYYLRMRGKGPEDAAGPLQALGGAGMGASAVVSRWGPWGAAIGIPAALSSGILSGLGYLAGKEARNFKQSAEDWRNLDLPDRSDDRDEAWTRPGEENLPGMRELYLRAGPPDFPGEK